MSIFRSKASKHKTTVQAYWHALAQCAGLREVPESFANFPGQRLIGEINGYLVMVRSGFLAEGRYPVLFVAVRYTPVGDEEVFQNAIKNDPALANLLGKPKQGDRTFLYNQTWVTFAYRPQKETAEQMANRIAELLKIIAKYVRPFQSDLCEGPDCRGRNATLQVVLVNQWPMLLCQDCINEVTIWGTDAQQAYHAAPTGLLRGVLAGSVIALLGGLGWAAVEILFNRIVAVIGALIFIGVVRIMDRVGTKRTRVSFVSAAMLTVLGVGIGSYLTHAWYEASGLAGGLSLTSLPTIITTAWQKLWATRLLGQSIVFCLLGVVPFLLWMWWEQRRYYSWAFHPAVEVIGTKWF